MVLVNSGFHTRKNFSEKYLQCGHAPSKVFASPVLGRKILRDTFQGAPTNWTGPHRQVCTRTPKIYVSLILHADNITNTYSN